MDNLQTSLPEGVSLSVHEHLKEHYEHRYIPDPFVDSIASELEEYEERTMSEKEKAALKKDEKAKKKAATLLASLNDDDDD